MHRRGAERIVRGDRAELHAASALSAFLRSRSVISPMIETAISAGDTAPISSPIGAWMRAMSASLQARGFEPLHALGMRLLGAERADIETIALERMQQRRIVDLGIMRERDEGRVMIDIERRQRDVGPFRDHLHVGKTLDRLAKAVRGSTMVTS